jgi:hypothetical protein
MFPWRATEYHGKLHSSMWDFRFSRRRVCNSESSGIYRRVVKSLSTDVSEVRAASIIRPNSILSHHHTIPLCFFYLGPPTLLPLAHFLTYRHPLPIGQSDPLVSYITRYLFALGPLIALMMETARTPETSVDIYLTTRQYIPADFELHYIQVHTPGGKKILTLYVLSENEEVYISLIPSIAHRKFSYSCTKYLKWK